MSFTYEMLTPEEELQMIEMQLVALEREHFNLTVVLPESSELTTTTRINAVESEITRLRALRDEMFAATPSS